MQKDKKRTNKSSGILIPKKQADAIFKRRGEFRRSMRKDLGFLFDEEPKMILLFLLFILSHFALNAIFRSPFKSDLCSNNPFKNIDDILRKEAGCQSELGFT